MKLNKEYQVGGLGKAHQFLLKKSKTYSAWDQKAYSSKVHFISVIIFGILAISFGYYYTFYSFENKKSEAVIGSLGTPRIVAPSDGSVLNSKRPTISWKTVTNATAYNLELYQDNALIKQATVTTNSYTPNFDLTDKANYYWRIRAIAQTTAAVDSPVAQSLLNTAYAATSTITPPKLLYPVNGQHFPSTTTRMNLDWSDVAGAKYIYQSSKSIAANSDGSFVTPAWTSGQLSYSNTTATGLSPNTYFWHVKSVDSRGASSAWSAVNYYVIDAQSTIIAPTTTPSTPTTTVTAQSPFSAYWNFAIDTSLAANFVMPDPSKNWLGAYVVDSGNAADSYASFENLAGKKHQVAQKFHSFYWVLDFPSAQAKSFYDTGHHYMVTWTPDNPTINSTSPLWSQWSNNAVATNQTFTNSSGATVHFDDYVTNWANEIKAYKKPVYIRFAHEMNGNWSSYGAQTNGNTPATYVAMWKHVHDIFVKNGVKNARWVWCPNGTPTGTLSSYFPGDDYVDVVAFDGYNWGNLKSWSSWMDFKTIFTTDYNIMAPLTKKDIWIGETSSTESGGSKAAWISKTFADAVTYLPRIKGIIWFEANKETDWRIESSTNALNAYKAAILNYVK